MSVPSTAMIALLTQSPPRETSAPAGVRLIGGAALVRLRLA
jgi:hypothetical protein